MPARCLRRLGYGKTCSSSSAAALPIGLRPSLKGRGHGSSVVAARRRRRSRLPHLDQLHGRRPASCTALASTPSSLYSVSPAFASCSMGKSLQSEEARPRALSVARLMRRTPSRCYDMREIQWGPPVTGKPLVLLRLIAESRLKRAVFTLVANPQNRFSDVRGRLRLRRGGRPRALFARPLRSVAGLRHNLRPRLCRSAAEAQPVGGAQVSRGLGTTPRRAAARSGRPPDRQIVADGAGPPRRRSRKAPPPTTHP